LADRDVEAGLTAAVNALPDSGWTFRTARDSLGQMVRYYDLFMRFLVIVGLGSLLIGGVSVWTGMRAYIAERSGVIAVLSSIGAAVGIPLAPAIHIQPLLIAAGTGLVTAFAFAYLPLQQAQAIRPVLLFRSKGLDAPPVDWGALLLSWQVLPLLLSILALFVLAWLMTGDLALVIAFGLASALGAALFQLFIRLAQAGLK